MRRLSEDLARISTKPHYISYETIDHGYLIYVWFTTGTYDKDLEVQIGRKWFIEKDYKEEDLFKTCLHAVLQFVKHETRENFYVDNIRVSDPHRKWLS